MDAASPRKRVEGRGFIIFIMSAILLAAAFAAWAAWGPLRRPNSSVETPQAASVPAPTAVTAQPLAIPASVQPAKSVNPQPNLNWGLEPLDKTIKGIVSKHSHKFSVIEGGSGPIFMGLIHQIPDTEFVDLVSFYKTIKGLDGTTTEEGAERLRQLYIGKYYVLQGDVFTIQADRDYPRNGMNEFSMFGEVRLVGSLMVPVNVDLVSTTKVPPYSKAAILSKITGFSVSTSRGGDGIIVPQVAVVALIRPSSCCESPEAVIINEY